MRLRTLSIAIVVAIGLVLLFLVGWSAEQSKHVDYVVDGDTFVLQTGEKVRLIGVDCPESQDPNKPVEYWAGEATAYLAKLIGDKTVRLEYGDERADKYGRLLCYVRVDDTVLVNLEIIKNGYGMAYLRFAHPREQEFLEAELTARRQAIGMWASPRSKAKRSGSEASEEYEHPKVKQSTAKDETVYITKTGSKYHRGSCGYLRKSKIPITKKDAISQGYGPCSRCRP